MKELKITLQFPIWITWSMLLSGKVNSAGNRGTRKRSLTILNPRCLRHIHLEMSASQLDTQVLISGDRGWGWIWASYFWSYGSRRDHVERERVREVGDLDEPWKKKIKGQSQEEGTIETTNGCG